MPLKRTSSDDDHEEVKRNTYKNYYRIIIKFKKVIKKEAYIKKRSFFVTFRKRYKIVIAFNHIIIVLITFIFKIIEIIKSLNSESHIIYTFEFQLA